VHFNQVINIPWTDRDQKISLPTEHTGNILSNFKALYRNIEDILDHKIRLTVFSKIFYCLNQLYIEPLINIVEEKLDTLHEQG
jgi:hypothetical protein